MLFLLWKMKIKNSHMKNGGQRREESDLELQAPNKKNKQVLTEDLLQFEILCSPRYHPEFHVM
jgi:hypothetical protein